MKNFFVLTFLISHFTLVAGTRAQSTDGLRKVTNEAYAPGEVLEYRVHYGWLDAGVARLEVAPQLREFGGRKCYHIIGTGNSVGAFDWFFKVRDRYESYIDTEGLMPWLFQRRVNEGGYIINQNVSFNHTHGKATSEKKTIDVPAYVQDLLSVFYYARTLDLHNAQPGDTFTLQTYIDDEVFPFVIKYIGKSKVKTKLGTFNCIAFHPLLLEGRVFKEQDGMTVWVTDDKNKIPVRAEAEILVGSVKMDITSFKGLANPVSLKK